MLNAVMLSVAMLNAVAPILQNPFENDKDISQILSVTSTIGTACFAFDFHGVPPSGIFRQFLRENKVNVAFEKKMTA